MPSNFCNTEAPLLLALAACPVSKLPFLTIDTLLHPVPSHAIPHPRSSCFGITIYRAIPYHVTQTESSTIFNIYFFHLQHVFYACNVDPSCIHGDVGLEVPVKQRPCKPSPICQSLLSMLGGMSAFKQIN